MKKPILLSVATCILCAGCGFQPMYGSYGSLAGQEQAGIQEQLSQIKVGNIPNREGQFLRNALIDRFYRNGRPVNPHYVLKVSEIKESTYDLDITVSSDATRAQLTLTLTANLIDSESEEMVLSRELKASASYNIMESEFATRVSEQNTRANILNEMERQIEQQIALYLSRAP